MTDIIPNPGLGTFRLTGKALSDAVTQALELGYRHIDTAQIYDNEAEIGALLQQSSCRRDELFLTTKIWLDNLSQERFIASVRDSLTKLQTDHVDLLLIHWPASADGVPMRDYLTALKEAKSLGLTRHIGVSNFTKAQLQQAIEILGDGELITNQIETHPYLQNRSLVDFCQANSIEVTGFMPLAVGKVMTDPTLMTLAEKYQLSVAQLVLAWLKQGGIKVIPSSTKRSHLADNLATPDITISDEDLSLIQQLDNNERIANPDFAPDWD